MPTLSVNHLTRYRYSRDVAFGEHRILVRPRESYDQRLLSADLEITPEPASLRWIQDVFGNAVAIATFDGRADHLEVRGSAEVEHLPVNRDEIAVEPYARDYPFQYAAEDLPDLQRSIERHFPDPGRKADDWARAFVGRVAQRPTLQLLADMAETIHDEFEYQRREEKGVQSPSETLSCRRGTCRDFAMLMMEAVRALGLAARFVSGYLYDPGPASFRVGGRSTHAWIRVFLPGSGWVEFDPTNGIVGNEGLIRVAVARDPAQTVPLSGTWRGLKDSPIDMSVDVQIKRVAITTEHADLPVKETVECDQW